MSITMNGSPERVIVELMGAPVEAAAPTPSRVSPKIRGEGGRINIPPMHE